VTTSANYTIAQSISGLTAGKTYTFSGWVNITALGASSSFKIQVKWINASGGTISTSTVKTYTAVTSGWNRATPSATLVAPSGTASAQVLMVLNSSNATVYVDDFVLQ
jgi:hypothetical protein